MATFKLLILLVCILQLVPKPVYGVSIDVLQMRVGYLLNLAPFKFPVEGRITRPTGNAVVISSDSNIKGPMPCFMLFYERSHCVHVFASNACGRSIGIFSHFFTWPVLCWFAVFVIIHHYFPRPGLTTDGLPFHSCTTKTLGNGDARVSEHWKCRVRVTGCRG
jgi:hypothetical protein